MADYQSTVDAYKYWASTKILIKLEKLGKHPDRKCFSEALEKLDISLNKRFQKKKKKIQNDQEMETLLPIKHWTANDTLNVFEALLNIPDEEKEKYPRIMAFVKTFLNIPENREIIEARIKTIVQEQLATSETGIPSNYHCQIVLEDKLSIRKMLLNRFNSFKFSVEKLYLPGHLPQNMEAEGQSPMTKGSGQLLKKKGKISEDQLYGLAATVKRGPLKTDQTLETHLKRMLEEKKLIDLGPKPCQLQKEQVIFLSHILNINRHIKELKLSGNSIGKKSTKALTKALWANKTLLTLDLSMNKIRDKEAAYLAHALEINTTLTTLLLTRNKIQGTGALEFVRVLKINKSLTRLDLSSNEIGENEKKALTVAWGVERSGLYL
eukprot:TRINITY_DN5708_c0_g1_i11.p1 TRINITY_DN5708_c0_g1~~TRINITY_DN5708_c0_g1_i11.p1  ORF type:complete len:380 (+),score=75.74 TRINITY_DN5708_c0_g1_i11:2740-3879(+)